MSGFMLSSHKHHSEYRSGNPEVSDSDEDAPENRPSSYVAPDLPIRAPRNDPLLSWRSRPANSLTYVPYWTDPLWDPRMELSLSGTQERERFGDAIHLSRPAVLPKDEARFPTPFARYDFPEELDQYMARLMLLSKSIWYTPYR